MINSDDAILWQASTARKEAAQLNHFMARASHEAGYLINDFTTLHNWSVAAPEQFWQTLWHYSEIIAHADPQTIIAEHPVMRQTRFFVGAQLNFAENLLRHNDDRPAILFQGEVSPLETLSYRQLRSQTAALTAAFKALGLGPGDRLAAIMPNCPQTIIAALAAASIGVIWSSCSPDFGSRALIDRFGQIQPTMLLSCNAYHYGGKIFSLADRLADLTAALPTLDGLILFEFIDTHPSVVDRLPSTLAYHDFNQLIETYRGATSDFIPLPFDHPLAILYSSGTTGKPKCIIHSAGAALLTHIKEQRLHCDLHPGDRLFYFTTCGWMMWNWLITGLASDLTLILYDGSPFHPHPTRLLDYCDQAGITHFGVSAKYIDALRKSGARPSATHQLSTLKTILSTGSPLAAESFDFVYSAIKADLHLVSMSGGTDIMGCFAGGNVLQPVRRGEIQAPALGMDVAVFNPNGKPTNSTGDLVCTKPFPSMPLGFWNDPDNRAYHNAYFQTYQNVWNHGDFVRWADHPDPQNNAITYRSMIIYGRSDATLNPAGVRIGPAEIYAAVEALDEILEAAAVGQTWHDDVRIILFVVLRQSHTLDDALRDRISIKIRTSLSPRHIPAKIIAVNDIPRTRSGKITELAIRDIIHNRDIDNREALANPESLAFFRNLPELAS